MNAPLRPHAAAGADPGTPPRWRVGVIGAGRVGLAIGAALAAEGHRVSAVSARSAAARDRIARVLPAAQPLSPAEVAASGADLLIIAVPDDALAAVAEELAPAVFAGQVVAHVSGAHGLAVLAAVSRVGARPLALHPAMTFTGRRADVARLTSGISFGVTAPTDLRRFAERLVGDLGGRVEWVAEGDRALYHAALAHGANHLVTLVNEGLDRLRDAGVVQPVSVLAPLLGAALANALESGDAALTGPVVRGDAGAVARHLRALDRVCPASVPPYVALARRTADRAIAAGQLPAAQAAALLGVLADARAGASA